MEVNYSALQGAATTLARAAAQVGTDRAISPELSSGAPQPNRAHGETVRERRLRLQRIGELLSAQSRATRDLVEAFRLLDAQIAARVTERGVPR